MCLRGTCGPYAGQAVKGALREAPLTIPHASGSPGPPCDITRRHSILRMLRRLIQDVASDPNAFIHLCIGNVIIRAQREGV